MPLYRDVNTFSGLPAAGCCPLESDVTSEGGQEAESEPASERTALSVQPAGRRRRVRDARRWQVEPGQDHRNLLLKPNQDASTPLGLCPGVVCR